MTTEPSPPPPAADAAPRKCWVWACSDESIRLGQISVLACAEIPLAMLLFWAISAHSPWPWATLVTMMAAPFLLLRSPASIEEGKARFKKYWESEIVSRTQLLVIFAISTLVVGAVVYFVRLPVTTAGYAGWALLAFIAVVAASVASFVAIPVAGMAAGADAGVGVALGFFIRAVFIRLTATMRHISTGLSEFPHNWREAVLVIDLWHPPELLPGAGEVSSRLSLKHFWRHLWRDKRDLVESVLFKVPLALLMYFPALLYRWNIKAGSFLWGPLAFVLRPVVWGDFEALRTRAARITALVVQGALACGVLFLVVRLLALPIETIPRLSDLAAITKLLPPPHLGLRYGLLWVLVFVLTGLLWSAHSLRSAYKDEIAHPDKFGQLSASAQSRIKEMSAALLRWQRWLLAISVMTIWVFALAYANHQWPNLIWGWLQPWL